MGRYADGERGHRYVVHEAPAAPLKVAARIAQHGARWSLTVKMETSERQVDGESCAAVAQEPIVIIALAIDPKADQAAFASEAERGARVSHRKQVELVTE